MVTYKKIICVLMIALLSVTQVYAIELESLKESDDYTEVQNAGENICNIVNTLNENNHINIGDINWDKIYKIYVDDSNIFFSVICFKRKYTRINGLCMELYG